jgi:hypothetical protein
MHFWAQKFNKRFLKKLRLILKKKYLRIFFIVDVHQKQNEVGKKIKNAFIKSELYAPFLLQSNL